MTEPVIDSKRPNVQFDERNYIVTVYCTPELYEVFKMMTNKQEMSGVNETFMLLKAVKQVKNLLLKDEPENVQEK